MKKLSVYWEDLVFEMYFSIRAYGDPFREQRKAPINILQKHPRTMLNNVLAQGSYFLSRTVSETNMSKNVNFYLDLLFNCIIQVNGIKLVTYFYQNLLITGYVKERVTEHLFFISQQNVLKYMSAKEQLYHQETLELEHQLLRQKMTF